MSVSMATLRTIVAAKNPRCGGTCQAPLGTLPIEHYDHENGWAATGFSTRQWLYLVCPQCRHQTSLEKLGIPKG
jgi:hypothetical protein